MTQIEKELRFLRIYSLGSTLLLSGALIATANQL